MNKEWIELLAGAKNFDEGELNKHIVANNDVQAGCMTYRNDLLKQMDTPNFTQPITVDNLQKWFLEPITEQKFTWIQEDIKNNYWTIEELWERCKAESVGILHISNQLNEDVKFYEGMKIYHNSHVANVLSEVDVLRINFIKYDELFNVNEFLKDIELNTIPLSLFAQILRIRRSRMKNATNFEMTKENIEYLDAEPMPMGLFMALKQAMRMNKWTLKELVQEALRQDLNIFMVSGCPNKALRGVTA